MKAAPSTNHTKDSDWKTLAQHRITAYLCTLFVLYYGEWVGQLYMAGCEGLTISVGLIMFRKLGTGGREQTSGSIPL